MALILSDKEVERLRKIISDLATQHFWLWYAKTVSIHAGWEKNTVKNWIEWQRSLGSNSPFSKRAL